MPRAPGDPPRHDTRPDGSAGPRWTSVAIPAEHGSWSLVLEPVVLGLVVAPSLAGLLVGLAAIAGFLADRPWKTWMRDRRRGRVYPRTVLARRFTLAFGAAAALMLLGAIASEGPRLLLPFALATPLGLLYLGFDRRPGRSWQAELAAPAAIAAVAAAESIAAGWSLAPGLALWVLAAARSLPAVLYVRERLRLERSGTVRRGLVWGIHILAALTVVVLGASGLVPPLAALPYVALLARAVAGLGPGRRRVAPKIVGISEIVWGVITVGAVAAAYGLGALS